MLMAQENTGQNSVGIAMYTRHRDYTSLEKEEQRETEKVLTNQQYLC